MMDDQEAIERCRAGDKEAFRYVVEHYQAEAIGHAIAILGNREDAMDAVQEAFIDTFQALDRIDLTRRFYPWFYIILRNRCYKLAAGRKKREMSRSEDIEIVAPTPGIRPEETMLLEQAMADGYISELSSDQVEAHLAGCSDCRREVGQMRALSSLLDRQERRQRTEDVWKLVEPRLADCSPVRSTSQAWHPFLLLGVLLLGYRIVEMVSERDFGFLFKLVPVLFVIAAFSYLRENPFKIDSELRLEGE